MKIRRVFHTFSLGIAFILLISIFVMAVPSPSSCPYSPEFEKAIKIIKKYEGMHYNKGVFIGYGHKILPGEGYRRNQRLSQLEAEELLRKDLAKLCEKYRSFGKDSLILAALAYNTGIGTVARSSVYKKLQQGNRDIKDTYLSYCKYRGRTMSQIKRRRAEEYDVLFIPDSVQSAQDSALNNKNKSSRV